MAYILCVTKIILAADGRSLAKAGLLDITALSVSEARSKVAIESCVFMTSVVESRISRSAYLANRPALTRIGADTVNVPVTNVAAYKSPVVVYR